MRRFIGQNSFYINNNISHKLVNYISDLEDLSSVYNVADLIITRAGAGALAEVKFFNKPAIIIPHKTNNTNHQIYNAQELAKNNQNFYILEQDIINQNN